MNDHRSPASTNQGVERSMPAAHLKPKRQPITNEMLEQMLSQLYRDQKPSHDRFDAQSSHHAGHVWSAKGQRVYSTQPAWV